MLVNLFENIPTTTEKNDIKVIYIFISNVKPYIQNSYLKLYNTHLFHLFVDMNILKIYLKKHDFARLMFSIKKFQEMETKFLFLSFQNSFSASYFPICQEQFDQNSSLIPL